MLNEIDLKRLESIAPVVLPAVRNARLGAEDAASAPEATETVDSTPDPV